MADLGYTDVWSSDANGADAFTPLALASVWAPSLRLGTAIVPAYTRDPRLLATTAATLAEAAPGRVALGIGASSDVIVEQWNDIPFERPFQRTRDVLRFLKSALAGEVVTTDYDSFSVEGFQLERVPAKAPSLLVAALREGMLRLAGRESDGAILNFLSADDVATVAPVVHDAAGGAPREIVARIFACPSVDADSARGVARHLIAAYLNVPVYAKFQEWLGHADQLQGMWDAWRAGDRKLALTAIPDEVLDALVVHGPAEACREHVQRYIDNGVTTPVIALLPSKVDQRQAMRDLAPSRL